MAQPHPSRFSVLTRFNASHQSLMTAAKRPCWHCGTRHESDTMPALCSDLCRDAWRELYQLSYVEEMSTSTPDLTVLQQLGTTFAQATAGLDALKAAVRAEQEQMNAEAGGLERHRAVLAGAPMSVLHDPDWRPADEPQDLAVGHALDDCPPRPLEPPADRRPLVDLRGMTQARQPLWRRLFGRSS